MIVAWLLSQTGVSRTALYGVVALLLLAVAAIAAASGFHAWRDSLAQARESGRIERDAHWKAEIANSNAAVSLAKMEAALGVAAAEARASADRLALSETIQQLEKANAALPNGDACGLGSDRVRLLPR
jgi:hypothetical protein